MKNPSIEINRRRIGPGRPVYIVAELSANHNQNFERAARMVQAAKESGADAVKIQTYTADTLTIPCDREYFKIGGGTLWDGRTLYDLYQEAYTPWDWQPKLKKIADELGIDFFSSAFDASAVDFLEKMNVPAHKVASFEIVDLALIQKMAGTGKPLIMSAGMATLSEIQEALSAARTAGAREVALLKCTSAYPAPPDESNLRTIPHLSETFKVPVGISDHTLGYAVVLAAVALGACIVEKHFTLSREIPSADSAFSLEPQEFKSMAEGIRRVEMALGQASYGVTESEKKSLVFRRSLFAVKNVKAGETFSEENVRSIRPGQGLAPKFLKDVMGKHAKGDIPRGTPLQWDHIDSRK